MVHSKVMVLPAILTPRLACKIHLILHMMTFSLELIVLTLRTMLGDIYAGSLVHFNNVDHYHITVQMVSHPSNPRPDSFVPGGGLEGDYPSIIPAPTPSLLYKETSCYKSIAGGAPGPELKVACCLGK